MSDDHHPIREAVVALLARGNTVEPCTGVRAMWLVYGETITTPDLIALVVQLGLMDLPSRVQ
jgi:hypothetical protein